MNNNTPFKWVTITGKNNLPKEEGEYFTLAKQTNFPGKRFFTPADDDIIKFWLLHVAYYLTPVTTEQKQVYVPVFIRDRLPPNGATVIWCNTNGDFKEGRYEKKDKDYVTFDQSPMNPMQHTMVCRAFTHWLEKQTITILKTTK